MFTLADVEAAVEATGLTPHVGDFVDLASKTACLCPASILVVAKHGAKAVAGIKRAQRAGGAASHVAKRLDHFGVSPDEVMSFASGVDGGDLGSLRDNLCEHYNLNCKKAYSVGKAVRKRYSLT